MRVEPASLPVSVLAQDYRTLPLHILLELHLSFALVLFLVQVTPSLQGLPLGAVVPFACVTALLDALVSSACLLCSRWLAEPFSRAAPCSWLDHPVASRSVLECSVQDRDQYADKNRLLCLGQELGDPL